MLTMLGKKDLDVGRTLHDLIIMLVRGHVPGTGDCVGSYRERIKIW